MSAIGQMFTGVEPEETLALAALACDVGDDAPQAPSTSAILSLLEARANYDPQPATAAPAASRRASTSIIVAAALARTPDVPLPEPPRF